MIDLDFDADTTDLADVLRDLGLPRPATNEEH